jgi:hypothetical protein
MISTSPHKATFPHKKDQPLLIRELLAMTLLPARPSHFFLPQCGLPCFESGKPGQATRAM